MDTVEISKTQKDMGTGELVSKDYLWRQRGQQRLQSEGERIGEGGL